jgi:MscS family membrane protein
MTDWLYRTLAPEYHYWIDWAIFAAHLLLIWIGAGLARRLLRALVPRLTARTSTTLDDQLAKASVRPVQWTILTLGLRASLEALRSRMPVFQAAVAGVHEEGAYAMEFGWVAKINDALVILAVTSLANALLKAALDWYLHELARKSHATWDKDLLPLVRRTLSLLLYFVAASIIFDQFGYPITALITTAGVASLAVALAAQETLSNMLGGFVIMVDRPFKLGDVIELTDGKAGEVVEIGLRSTHIKQFDGNALVVPNKDMANSRVINYALPNHRAAIRQTISLHLDTDMTRAKAVVLAVLEAHPEVLKDPAPGVWFTKFGINTLDLFMSGWVASYQERFRITDQLNIQLLQALRANHITFAFAQQDVRLYVREGGVAVAPEPNAANRGDFQPDGEA